MGEDESGIQRERQSRMRLKGIQRGGARREAGTHRSQGLL